MNFIYYRVTYNRGICYVMFTLKVEVFAICCVVDVIEAVFCVYDKYVNCD